MDNKETITNTSTEVKETKVETKETKVVNNVVFILFAEFIGYESPLIEWCEKICKGSYPPNYVNKILDIEARMIFKKMQEEYTIEEIRNWYDQFYPLVLEEYDLKLQELEKDSLPF